MDERRFRNLFQAAIGEAPIPPDLALTARRALDRRDERRGAWILQLAAAAAAVLIVVGFVGFNLLTHRPGSAPAGPGATAAPSPAATPEPSPAASPSPAGPLACAADQMTLTRAGTQGAAGHLFATFVVINGGTAACTISGYPSAQLLAPGGAPVATRVIDGGGQLGNTPGPVELLLAPHGTARFQLSWGDIPVGNQGCDRVDAVEVGLPGQSPSPKLVAGGLNAFVCNSGELDASAFTAG